MLNYFDANLIRNRVLHMLAPKLFQQLEVLRDGYVSIQPTYRGSGVHSERRQLRTSDACEALGGASW